MPRLLVSVRNLVEAELARQAAVDIVDLKEPDCGALGPVDRAEREQIAAHWLGLGPGEHVPPLSLALGELQKIGLSEWPHAGPCPAVGSRPSPFRYAKLGLSGLAADDRWPELWNSAARLLSPPTSLVAAAYADAALADAPAPEAVLELALAEGAEVFLLDTFQKRAGSVLDVMTASRLDKLRAQAAGQIEFALAGSLRLQHAPQLHDLKPEIVAVRGAVCSAGRSSPICRHRLKQWREWTGRW